MNQSDKWLQYTSRTGLRRDGESHQRSTMLRQSRSTINQGSVLSAEEKFRIRGRLLDSAINTPASVARQVIIATARIARLDYPTEWPEVIDEISVRLSQAQNEPRLLLQHMLMLHQVIKALASLRMASARSNFHKVRSPQCLPVDCCSPKVACTTSIQLCGGNLRNILGNLACQWRFRAGGSPWNLIRPCSQNVPPTSLPRL